MRSLFPLFLLVLLAGCAGPPPPAGSGPEAGSPAAIEVVAPRGAVGPPLTFEWAGQADGGIVYRVAAYDNAQRRLFELETRRTSLPAPRELAGYLREGIHLYWQVTVTDETGRVVRESPLTEFWQR